MPNPFTAEVRKARLSLGLDGLEKLRTPPSLHALVMRMKPGNLSATDFALTAMLNEVLIGLIVRGDYRAVHATLGTLFAFDVPNGRRATDTVSEVPKGPDDTKRYAKAGARP
jgi:hypothetical protein